MSRRSSEYRQAGRRRQGKSEADRQRIRLADKRVQASLEKTRREQAELDRKIAEAEAAQPPPAPKPAAFDKWLQEEEARLAELELLKEQIRKRSAWTLDQARDLIRQGYTMEHVTLRTGWRTADIIADGVIYADWMNE